MPFPSVAGYLRAVGRAADHKAADKTADGGKPIRPLRLKIDPSQPGQYMRLEPVQRNSKSV